MNRPVLAVSDTPLARLLIHEGRLERPVETGGPLAASAVTELPGHPLLLHNSVWNWSLAHPRALEQGDVLSVTRTALAQTHAPWLSVHLGFSAETVTFQGGFQTASETLSREAVVTNITASADALKAALGVPLLLENLDYNRTGAYDHICEPEVIRTVLEATDTSFLLDLSHAQVSASRLGFALDDLLAGLPLDRVKQLHVNGPRQVGETLKDVHETMRKSDYELLEAVLGQTQPWAVTLEYGRDAAALLAQVDRLQSILNG